MYARTIRRPTQVKSRPKMFPAPTAGWISNRALATPNDGTQLQGAAVLDNFFPRATSVLLRRGKLLYCTLGMDDLDASALFSYNNGENRKLFGATSEAIYDITSIVFADNSRITDEDGNLIVTEDGDWFGWSSTLDFIEMEGLSGGNWIVVQFATTGGVFLVGVNGVDTGFIYDGTSFYPNVAGGIYALDYDAQTVAFTEGAILTGGTSGATGTIVKVIPNPEPDELTGTLWLKDVTGDPFTDDETITDDGPDTGSADANGAGAIAVPGMDFGSLTSADMSFVWVYKNRLWFAEKDTMNAWYLDDVDAVGGGATIFPLAGVFGKGGTLLFGQAWSLETGSQGGLSEQNVFVSSEGEVAVYQGDDPTDAATWARVGFYRIGRPLGNRAFIRGGGDIAVATSVGLVPLSKAVTLDVTSLNVATISYNIADAWTDATQLRGMENWQAEIWPEQKMAIVAPPNIIAAGSPVMFVSNTETGAWGRYTGWQALSMEVFEGRLYFGSADGRVFLANVSGQDYGEAYSGAVLPLFDDFGTPSSEIIPTVGRAVVRAQVPLNDNVTFKADFDMNLPPAPDATAIGGAANIWDAGVWGVSVWNAETPQTINQHWRSLGGTGYAGSLAYQVTSGSVQPLDAEVIRLELLFTTAAPVT